ncbi:hypothetical protein GCM10025298_04570 [Natronobiforma cellulositropha]
MVVVTVTVVIVAIVVTVTVVVVAVLVVAQTPGEPERHPTGCQLYEPSSCLSPLHTGVPSPLVLRVLVQSSNPLERCSVW